MLHIYGANFGGSVGDLAVIVSLNAAGKIPCTVNTVNDTLITCAPQSDAISLAPGSVFYATLKRLGGSSGALVPIAVVEPPANGGCNLVTLPPGAVCLGNGTILIIGDFEPVGTNVNITNPVVIVGSVNVQPGTVVTIGTGGFLNVSSCLTVSGILTIDYSQGAPTTPGSPILVTVAEANCIDVTGQINVVAPECQRVVNGEVQVVDGPSNGRLALTYLFELQPIEECGNGVVGPNIPVIVGTVVAAGVVAIAIIVSVSVPAFRKRIFPFINRRNEAS
jgi:hypothetical protein